MSRVNNKEKYKEYDHNYYIKHKRPKSKIGQAELKITDLEAKLAEKENEIKTLICDYESRITKTHELMSWLEHENEELKQQLAEKEKENEELKLKLDIRAMNLQNINTERMEAVRNQTQLAIQELEKVKDTLKHFCNIHSDEYYMVKSQVKGIEQDVCDQINQQIKELKGE